MEERRFQRRVRSQKNGYAALKGPLFHRVPESRIYHIGYQTLSRLERETSPALSEWSKSKEWGNVELSPDGVKFSGKGQASLSE